MSSLSWYQVLFPARSTGYHILHKCFETLQQLSALINGLSEHRRRKIQMAYQRGGRRVLSVEDLELELDRCTFFNLD